MIEWKRIFDMHNWTIKPGRIIELQKLCTYPCAGMDEHTVGRMKSFFGQAFFSKKGCRIPAIKLE